VTRLTVNGCNYNVEVRGSGIPLVLLHGFTGSTLNWRSLIEELSWSYTTIGIDLLGHGRSDAPLDPQCYTMDRAATDLARLIQVLTACPVNLLGYSMGGRLALYLTRHYPELITSLVLESASPGLADPWARQQRRDSDELLAQRIEREGIPAFVDYWEKIPLFASQQSLPAASCEQLRSQRLQNRAHGLANSLRGMGTGQQPSLWDDLTTIRQPTLLLAGASDAKYIEIARQMRERMPHARLQIIPDAGHAVHLEAPQAFEIQVMMFVHTVQFMELDKDTATCPTPSMSLAAAAH
jgi:2-succinyl-6-hydroxy-2,4-cyclohexadiene-1-carboxylate synthase